MLSRNMNNRTVPRKQVFMRFGIRHFALSSISAEKQHQADREF